MSLAGYLDKGASLGPDEPCLVAGDRTFSYADVQALADGVARALRRSGVRAGDKVAILSSNDPIAFSAVFGISRAGAVWCPVNPRNEAGENRELLDLFDCSCLIFQSAYAPLVEKIAPDAAQADHLRLPRRRVCRSGRRSTTGSRRRPPTMRRSADPRRHRSDRHDLTDRDDTVMLVGTGGTTGTPKGVILTDRNLEAMSAITLMCYPFHGRPTYLALAPLTHAAGVLCFPIMAMGGRVVIMDHADVGEFLHLIESAPGDAHVPAADRHLHGAGPSHRADDGLLLAAVLLVRRGADVAGPPRGGDRGVRAGNGSALRPVRGADDDLHAGAVRAPAPRRLGRASSGWPPPGVRRRW